MANAPRYHSVILDEANCKGCTVCVTNCPAEAIRVRDGKAHILDTRCIDCGECIRICPNHAKKARSDTIEAISSFDSSIFTTKIALPAPSLYGQFSSKYSISMIHAALREFGFTDVFPVALATGGIARSVRSIIDFKGELKRPWISSSCPTIIKYIQIRFPTLLDHIVPVIAPMELAAILAKKKYGDTGKTGCYFISPCPGKITEAEAPLSQKPSAVDRVISMKDIHLPLLQILSKMEHSGEPDSLDSASIAWGRAGGEAESVFNEAVSGALAVDGLDQCKKILEQAEDGNLDGITFLELMACQGGCAGGALTVQNPALCRHILQSRERDNAAVRQGTETDAPALCYRTETIQARPALLLDTDYAKAYEMMEQMETITGQLPGLDCGCCGSPGCRALAEDIVRGRAELTDCVIILKEQYRELLDKK